MKDDYTNNTITANLKCFCSKLSSYVLFLHKEMQEESDNDLLNRIMAIRSFRNPYNKVSMFVHIQHENRAVIAQQKHLNIVIQAHVYHAVLCHLIIVYLHTSLMFIM